MHSSHNLNSCICVSKIQILDIVFELVMDPIENLFGRGDGMEEPWHQWHKCQCMEVKQDIVDFLRNVADLHGDWHDAHGYVIDFGVWVALLQYVRWCDEQKLDFNFHVSQVLADDGYYTRLAISKLAEYGA